MRKSISIAISLAIGVLVAIAIQSGIAGTRSGHTVAFRDRWNATEVEVLASLRLSQLPPARQDPSNSVDGSRAAAELGKRVFNDVRFSQNQAVSCATCHDAAKKFQDGLALARGVGIGSRRAMPIVGSGYSPWLFWDGRKDSLWCAP